MKRTIFFLAALLTLPIAARAQAPAPGSVNWKGTPHGVTLTCTSNGGVGFNFYRGTATGGPYIKINTAPATACAFQDLAAAANGPATSTTYFYVATAVDAAGNESAYSLEATATTPSSFQSNPPATSKPTATIF